MSPLPSKIGRYEIKSLIGRGGMGDLYLAWDPNTTRLVALKLLNATIDSIESRERFAREARALAALNHHNIVNIYDTGEFDDALFIVMEYVRGETLAEIIKRRAVLTVPQKLKLMAELCNGLAQAHEAGIIHRDIKPANLMVDSQGRLKILDFGIARVAGGSGTRVGLPLTQVNMVIGTTGYMSPEQIEGREVDHRSDIFAVGAVCYELFAYGEAFSGANTGQIERKVLQGQPVPLSSIVPGLDPEIDAIVLRALKKDPNKRYQDAATLERDLERLRLRLGQDAPGLSPRRTAPPPPGGRGTSRDPRAEEAYQRALAADQAGATDAARRFAVEALAHDRSHAAARALLARLDPLSPLAGTAQSPGPRRPAPPTVIITSTTQVAPSTVVGTSARKAPPTIASAPTIIVAPGTRAASRWTQPLAFWSSDGPLRRRWDALWKRDPASSWARQRHEPLWTRYSTALLTVSLLALVALIVGGAVFFGRWLGPSGQLLTITRPVGGTISVAGITCGPRDADCTVTRPTGDAIELRPEADTGYQFVGYKGDCAPSGRTIMTGPRTCGATFDKVEVQAPPSTQPLTIVVPQGGTITGVEIKCGSQGAACSANYPDGETADLYPVPDPGYTFMGFTGDCKLLVGHTKMTGPRTCGATFSPTPAVTTEVLSAPRSGGGRTGRSGRETPVAPINDGTPPSPVASEPSRGAEPAAPVGVRPVPPPQGPVVPPPTPEEFAKGKIRDVLKEFCAGFVALDPVAVQRVFPKVNMEALKLQLNKSKYKSIQCTFGDPTFVLLDPSAGTATVQADRKLVYDHIVGSQPPEEQTVDMTFLRQSERSPWQIETAKYTIKKK